MAYLKQDGLEIHEDVWICCSVLIGLVVLILLLFLVCSCSRGGRRLILDFLHRDKDGSISARDKGPPPTPFLSICIPGYSSPPRAFLSVAERMVQGVLS